MQKISELETDNKDNEEKLQAQLQKKVEEMHTLQKVSEKHEQRVNLLEKQVDELHDILEEKEQLILQYNEHEKELEEKTTKVLKGALVYCYVEYSKYLNSYKLLYFTAESGIVDSY